VYLGEFVTKKKNELAFPFLDADAVQVIRDLLEGNKLKPDSEKVLNLAEDSLSLIL
jgi:hypothetical protein